MRRDSFVSILELSGILVKGVPLGRKGDRRLHKIRYVHFFHTSECAHSYLSIYPFDYIVHLLLHESYQIGYGLYTHAAWLEEVDCYVYAYQVIKYIPHSTYRYCTTTDVPQISHIHPVSMIVVVCITLLNLIYCWIFGLRIPLLIGSWLLCNTPICIDTDHTTDWGAPVS